MADLNECVITSGPGVSISCEQREDGAIALLITHSINSPGVIQKERGFGQDASWSFSEKHAASSNKIVFRFPQGGNDRSKRSILLQDLTERINKDWPKRVEKIEQNRASWLENASLFFGRFEFTTAEQWSSHNLDSAEPEIKRERGPWYRVNLARRLNERLQVAKRETPDYSELNCRRTILAEIYPDFNDSDEKRKAYQKRFQRRINHGRVESKLLRISAALLLTVAPVLNYDELKCLSQRWEDSWLSQEVIEASKKYEQLAVALLFFMDQIGKCSAALLQRSIHIFSTITWTLTLDRRPNRLSQEGLVKFHEMPIGTMRDAVFSFYVHPICNGRTILSDNIYSRVVQVAKVDQSTAHALFALSASYYKEYLPESSPERREAEQLERNCMSRAFSLLPQAGPARDAALMLLIHHAIINPGFHKSHWTQYLYQLNHYPGQQMNVVIAAHAVWLMAVLPLDDRYEFQKFDYHWLGHDCPELSMVNSILGLSRKMLYFQYIITMGAKTQQTPPCQSDFLQEIDESPQVLHEQDLQRPLVKTVATATMEAYRLATRLYACGRLYRLSPSNAIMKQDAKLLVGRLESLPTEGDGYSGIHPAFCFIIACMCIEEVEDFAKLYGIFERIGLANKSNVLDLCALLTWIWNWKISSRVLGEDWWEEQANMLNSKMDGKPICVT